MLGMVALRRFTKTFTKGYRADWAGIFAQKRLETNSRGFNQVSAVYAQFGVTRYDET
jgi:hypothetical protein